MYSTALSQTDSEVDWLFGSAFVGSRKGLVAKFIDLSDLELEQWFSRHRSELVNLTSLDIADIAAWLHAIGPPANDIVHRQIRELSPVSTDIAVIKPDQRLDR